jgi:tetratricopeptide (TPR) repeat protein
LGISGSVRDADGQQAVESAQVQLWSLSAGMVASTFTNSTGSFSFVDVPRGSYYLIVKANGYEQLREEMNLSAGPPTGLQLLIRRPRAFGASPVGNAPTVSVRELSIPRPAREAMQRGLVLMHEKADYKGSIAQFERAVREYSAYYEAHMQMGLAYMMMGDTAQTEQALLTSISLSERKYPEALWLLASVYSGQQRYAEAETLAREATTLDPLSWSAHHELARALHGLDRPGAAEAAALEAKRINPDNAQIYLLLANIHMKMNSYEDLIGDLDAYLEREPEGPQAEQARKTRAAILEHLPSKARAE